ncbi:MAG: VCBS repeat-containing protein [Candidatus Hydrogenedentes bacterium]|nr:VCBS repeat-containing protein [Candidatus Hydrogenedentota bacterium]
MLKFERQKIGEATYEAAAVFDVNNDGVLDIVSGEYWFEGPDFKKAHKICSIRKVEDYYDDFSNFPMDVNGDGYMDIVTGGWWGETLSWRENPKGQPVEWVTHDIAKIGNIERCCFWDIDGCGVPEILPNSGRVQRIFKLVRDANGKGTGAFKEYVIAASDGHAGHGVGYGDINGDGRGDIILPTGWLECPPNPLEDPWTFHPEFNLGSASVPVLVHDVNEDGLPDIIVGAAHDYGLWWYEQGKDAQGNRTWTKRDIDPKRSQYHDMQLVDIDNDGKLELVTGKRYRAHQEHDPGSLDPLGLYYFKINKGEFTRYTIDYGPAADHAGAGIYFWVQDIDNSGWKSVVAPGKQGLYLFRNKGKI